MQVHLGALIKRNFFQLLPSPMHGFFVFQVQFSLEKGVAPKMPRGKRRLEPSSPSSSDSDDGPLVPRQETQGPAALPTPGGSKAAPTKFRKQSVQPARNKPIWLYFKPDPDFVKKNSKDFAKV